MASSLPCEVLARAHLSLLCPQIRLTWEDLCPFLPLYLSLSHKFLGTFHRLMLEFINEST
jgi:hypothetical protein